MIEFLQGTAMLFLYMVIMFVAVFPAVWYMDSVKDPTPETYLVSCGIWLVVVIGLSFILGLILQAI